MSDGKEKKTVSTSVEHDKSGEESHDVKITIELPVEIIEIVEARTGSKKLIVTCRVPPEDW